MKKIISALCIATLIITTNSMVFASNTIIPRVNTKKYYYVTEPGSFKNNRVYTYPYKSNNAPMNNNSYPWNTYQNYSYNNGMLLEKGWHTDNNGKFYYKGDGSIYKNCWAWIDGKNYRFDYNGYIYRNQWIKDNNTGSWYFVNADGASVVGWNLIDSVWHYFIPEVNLYGVLARNTSMYINDPIYGNGFYAFNNDGAVITNSWYCGHYYGPNGIRLY